MKSFPKDAKFCFPWRIYQKEVLENLELHLDDNHLNIVAAPGAGKTILGLEVMLRINKPTLILAPSIAIRNQWVTRFMDHFLQEKKIPDWISMDIKKPKFLTVSTYQGLHAAFTKQEEKSDEELAVEEVEENGGVNGEKHFNSSAEKVIKKLKTKGVKTIVIDEAHHLRNEWWKSLTLLKNSIEKPRIVALTATPPYDVLPQEWKNYQELCGPIDAEISVPELVMVDNLCPHQDFVYLNSLAKEEDAIVSGFRFEVKNFLKNLKNNLEFIEILKEHPCLNDPERHIEEILKNPSYYSSILIFLNETGNKVSKDFLKIINGGRSSIPKFKEDWGEILLKHLLYKDDYFVEGHNGVIKGIKRELKAIGGLEKRSVYLRDNPRIKKLLKGSINKLNSILEIVELEHDNLGDKLRMVILTDYIRGEFLAKKGERVKKLKTIGVIPIFEKLRRRFSGTRKIGVLSGSIVIVPETARESVKIVAGELGIANTHIKFMRLANDENYLKVNIRGENNHKIVQLITKVFNQGEIEILTGTKSLLGEGWDAPSINTLILASFVGSFMLSNQMRGRAIRIDKAVPDKVSNIWHLVSVEKNKVYAGHDFSILRRRFKAFVGISTEEDVIENGFERMEIGLGPFSERNIRNINKKIEKLAVDRDGTREKWKRVLENGEVNKIVHEVQTEKMALPRKFVFLNTIYALVWRSLIFGAAIFMYFSETIIGPMLDNNANLREVFSMAITALVISIIVTLPGLIKALWLFLRNGPITWNMKQIARALLNTLCKIDVIKTDVNRIRVIAEKNKRGMIVCGLEGGTSYEKSIFLDSLEEILNPINNPRYILIRKSKFNFLLREDFHTVPQIIGAKKKSAQYFSLMWNKYVGPNKLIYTRNMEGRKLLLNARRKAMSTSLQKRSERVDTWK